MEAYITEDNFVWLDVTKKMSAGAKVREDFWRVHDIFAVYDDGSEHLLESHDEIDEAIRLGIRVCIEGGHLSSLPSTQGWWDNAKKIVTDGYVYVRFNDIKAIIKNK